MNDILFGNNNTEVIKKIIKRELTAEKKRNFFIIVAIFLTAFMLTSVFSIGMSYYHTVVMGKKRIEGSLSQMAFGKPTEEQLARICTLDYVETIGISAIAAQTKEIPGIGAVSVAYVDQTQWEEMFCPVFTDIEGYYPEKENEIMLSRYLLEALGIRDAKVGMTVPVSYYVNGAEVTKDFILSCIYTEYSHGRPGSQIAVYCSRALAESSQALEPDHILVNLIFKEGNVEENLERLKADLPFYKDQVYVISPAFEETQVSTAAYAALGILILVFMFAGYLLVYNVMYLSVAKEVRFFGILKTLGTTPGQIRRIVVGQVMHLCLIGVPCGCLAAAFVSLLLVPAVIINSGIHTGAIISFSPLIYIGTVIFTVLTAWMGAAAPAKMASGISPVEALHYIGGKSKKKGARRLILGSVFHMALRNVFRDRKRSVIVILSLFLGLTMFISVMMVVKGIDMERYLDEEYKYDFLFTGDMVRTQFLRTDFIWQVQNNKGVQDASLTQIAAVELKFSENLQAYAERLAQNSKMDIEDIMTDDVFFFAHTLKGIDMVRFDEINAMFGESVDRDSFERGETAIINITDETLLGCFDGVSVLEIRKEGDKEFQNFLIGNVTVLPPSKAASFQYSSIEILVSNSFMDRYAEEPQILELGINVDKMYEESLYDTFKALLIKEPVLMVSRYEGRRSMQDTQQILFVLGSGISMILGLIGIINFINVMSVGIMSRRHEIAALESIGMSKKQLRSMLRYEGIGYAAVTLFFWLTAGNAAGICFFHFFQKKIMKYVIFVYPVIQVLIVYGIVILICLITPEIIYHEISRNTLVERMRGI